MEGIIGLGCAVGPVIGVLIYEKVGFVGTFIVFGVAMLPPCFLSCFLAKPGDIKKERAAAKE